MSGTSKHPCSSTDSDRDAPWFQSAFGADYAARYAHRDDAQAGREMQFLLKTLNLPVGAHVLDLCCGSGRHLRVMLAHKLDAVGIDLSADLLKLAQADNLPVAQADMRTVPHPDGAFEAVFNLFTSFGYFDDIGNLGALREMARLLKPGGHLVIDVLNPVATLTQLQPHTEKAIRWDCAESHAKHAARLIEQRRYNPVTLRLEKTVRLWSPDGATLEKECLESVRVYFTREWPALLAAANLRPVAVYGNLDGDPFVEATSPRQVIHAVRV